MMMQNILIAIRLDFGPEFGLGHLTRCITLADYLTKKNVKVIFISKTFIPNAKKWIDKYEIFFLDHSINNICDEWTQELDAQLTLKILSQFQKVDWVIVDNYELDSSWEKLLGTTYKVAAIEDLRNRKHAAAIIISESPTEFPAHLISDTKNTRLLIGPQFSIIAKKPVKRLSCDIKPKCITVLITYGASDLTNESLKALKAAVNWQNITSTKFNIKVALIIGPHYSNSTLIQNECFKAGVKVYKAPKDIQDLLRRSDLVLTTGGNTMVEALNYCCLTIVTTTEENQIPLVNHLKEKEVIFDMGLHDTVTSDKLFSCLTYISGDVYNLVNRVIDNNPFDGQGCERIYGELF